LAAFAAIASAASLQSNAEMKFGSIEGQVIDSKGKGIPGAKVFTAPNATILDGLSKQTPK